MKEEQILSSSFRRSIPYEDGSGPMISVYFTTKLFRDGKKICQVQISDCSDNVVFSMDNIDFLIDALCKVKKVHQEENPECA